MIREEELKGIDCAVIDGSIQQRPNDWSRGRGETVATAIRVQYPRMPVIAFSGCHVRFGELVLHKRDLPSVNGEWLDRFLRERLG